LRHVAALQPPRKNIHTCPAHSIFLALLRTSVLLLPHRRHRPRRTPEFVLLRPQCVLLPISIAPEKFLSLPPVVSCRRRPPAPRPAAGRAMVHTHGSEPSVNQNVLLPSFIQSYGALHAHQCYTVCYAILTTLGEARREVGSQSFYFFLAGRGNIRGEKTVTYGTQSAPLSSSTAGQ